MVVGAAEETAAEELHLVTSNAKGSILVRLWVRMHRLLNRFLASCLSMKDIREMLGHKMTKGGQFTFDSCELAYFYHCYNSLITERIVEVPIVKHYLDQGKYEDVLEIGNVTNHYYDYFRQAFRRKTVIDKYELAYDVINLDICEYRPDTRFDFCFSISTFEHMDSDRGRNAFYKRGASKLVSYAADNMKYVLDFLLKDGGKFVVTAPLGYSIEWDETVYSGVFEEFVCTGYRMYVYKKARELVWNQVGLAEGKGAKYGFPFYGVNYLSIIEFDR